MLEPKAIQVKTGKVLSTTTDGQGNVVKVYEEKTFTISKFDCISGREIVTSYPLSALPKVGDYKTNEAMMLKLMCFVAVDTAGNGTLTRLVSADLVRNHVPDWETLARLEMETLEYNVSFFGRAEISTFLRGLVPKAQAWITKTLTDLSAQSSKAGGQPSKN